MSKRGERPTVIKVTGFDESGRIKDGAYELIVFTHNFACARPDLQADWWIEDMRSLRRLHAALGKSIEARRKR